MYYGMCILEFSSARMHVGINSLLYIFLHMSYVFTCFCISRWFRIHSTSAYNLAEGQVVILEGRKLGNYLGGGIKRKLCYSQYFDLRKTQYYG